MTLWKCTNCGKLYEGTEKSGLSAGKAAAGAIIAGPAGAIVGAAMGKKKEVNCCPHCGSSLRVDAFSPSASKFANPLEGPQQAQPIAEPVEDNRRSEKGPHGNYTAESAAKRALLFLEDEEWDKATEYAEAALDLDPECGTAYWALFMKDYRIASTNDLTAYLERRAEESFEKLQETASDKNYQKAVRYTANADNNPLEKEMRSREGAQRGAIEKLEEFSKQAAAARSIMKQAPFGWSTIKVLPTFSSSHEHSGALLIDAKGNAARAKLLLKEEAVYLPRKGFMSDPFYLEEDRSDCNFPSQGHYVSATEGCGCVFLLTDKGRIEVPICLCPPDTRSKPEFRDFTGKLKTWANIIAVSSCKDFILGLQANGKILLASPNKQCEELSKKLRGMRHITGIDCYCDSFGSYIIAALDSSEKLSITRSRANNVVTLHLPAISTFKCTDLDKVIATTKDNQVLGISLKYQSDSQIEAHQRILLTGDFSFEGGVRENCAASPKRRRTNTKISILQLGPER